MGLRNPPTDREPKARSLSGLFGREEALLLLGDLEEPPRRFSMRLGHDTILQLF